MRVHVQMAPAATKHIGNHKAWAEQRVKYIRAMAVLETGSGKLQTAVVTGALAETRTVQGRHKPLLISDMMTSIGHQCPPFAQSTLV